MEKLPWTPVGLWIHFSAPNGWRLGEGELPAYAWVRKDVQFDCIVINKLDQRKDSFITCNHFHHISGVGLLNIFGLKECAVFQKDLITILSGDIVDIQK